MSSPSSSRSTVGPLSVGNVVSAALRLYKDHFKPYLGVAFRGTLWSVLPFFVLLFPLVIGAFLYQVNAAIAGIFFIVAIIAWLFFWSNCIAKYLTHLALLSRLSYQTLINQPETVKQAHQQIIPKRWRFLLVQIFTSLLVFAITIIPRIFLVEVPTRIFEDITNNLGLFIILIGQFLYLALYLWATSRLFIPEVPLAVENDITNSNSIRRSWDLSKGFAWKIATIILVANLATLPIYILAGIPLVIGFFATAPLWTQSYDLSSLPYLGGIAFLALLAAILIFVFLNVLAIPFWQSLKAVIYYDLRSRKEGIGLELRDAEFK
jgi:hypothetical protein